jgi:hypothetical protein
MSCPISDMPTELLHKIFYYAFSCAHNPAHDLNLNSPGLFLRAVCRRWHDVVDGYALIWTSISLSSAQIANLLLSRSQPLPITIALQRPCDAVKTDTFLDAFIDRFRVGELVLESGWSDQVIRHLLKEAHRVPELHTLKIKTGQGTPPILFGKCTAPKLRSLIVDARDTVLTNGGVIIADWLPPLLRSPLEKLQLYHMPSDVMSQTIIADAIEHLPSLRNIVVRFS